MRRLQSPQGLTARFLASRSLPAFCTIPPSPFGFVSSHCRNSPQTDLRVCSFLERNEIGSNTWRLLARYSKCVLLSLAAIGLLPCHLPRVVEIERPLLERALDFLVYCERPIKSVNIEDAFAPEVMSHAAD